MAYNSKYNPDALPAHAEPEQVAQMLGALQMQQQSHSHSHQGQHQGQHQERPPPPPKTSGAPPPRRVSPSSAPTHPPSSAPAPGQAPLQHGGRNHSASVSGPQSQQYRFHSPPPQNYGYGPRPTHAAQNRPPPQSHPYHQHPPPAPSSDDPQQLYPLFCAANVSKTGALTESELGSALVNGDYSAFDPNTVKMMVRMFDRNGDGTITFDEFVSLWRYLAAWRELFDRFDEDRSGRISLDEFEKALIAFGYRLSRTFVRVLFATFEGKGRRRASHGGPFSAKGGMSFDLFVQACISLKRMTDVFKRYDDDRDGYITVSFEEFLTEILQLQE